MTDRTEEVKNIHSAMNGSAEPLEDWAVDTSPPLSLAEAARDYAKRGIKIFPCAALGKNPACANGFKDATTDLDQIAEWWPEGEPQEQSFNIGTCPNDQDMAVVDLDPGGEEGWTKLIAEHGANPPTSEVRTPRGGRHLYFEGSLPSGVNNLAPHIDTRGVGGYVLLPPSYVKDAKKGIDGAYKLMNAAPAALLPAWIGERVKEKRKGAIVTVAPAGVNLDSPANVWRARRHMEAAPDGVEGKGSDTQANKLANQLLDLTSYETALDLMQEWGARSAQADNSSFDPWYIEGKVESAASSRQNAIGCWAGEWPQAWLDMLREVARNTAAAKRRFFGHSPAEDAKLPPLTYWDADKLYPNTVDGAAGLVAGKFGTLKTQSTIYDLMSIIKAQIDAGQHPMRVIYAVGEGSHGVRKERVPAVAADIGLTLDELGKYWRTIENVPNLTSETDIDECIEDWQEVGRVAFHGAPNCLVLDTLGTASGDIDENTKAMGDLLRSTGPVGQIKAAFPGMLVIVIAHVGKDIEKGVRGHSSLEQNADFVLIFEFDDDARRLTKFVHKMRDGEDKFTVEYRVTPKGALPLVTRVGRVTNKKAKPPADQSRGAIVLAALRWMSEFGMEECSPRQLYLAEQRRALWWDNPHAGATAPQLVLATPMTPEEQAGLAAGLKRLVRLATDRKAVFGTLKIAAKGPKDKEWRWHPHAAPVDEETDEDQE